MKKIILNIGIPLTLLIIAIFIIGPACSGDPDDYSYNWWPDTDQDGFGDSFENPIMATNNNAPANHVRDNSDCDDNNADIYPSATETPDNTIDEDCNGLYGYTFYADKDGDGFGAGNPVILDLDLGVNTPDNYSTNDADCDDNNAAMNPLADEIFNNGMDDNCNGETDTDDIRYIDADGDGYGSTQQSAADGVFNSLDCDDTNDEIHPYAVEKNNGIDDDCDGAIDEGL
ncbi:putative metal-binding motif-containing protein [uncultured Lutibacter sp.]|uniref:putative metal-binding motif-containing protein n=1 Tax=uncultured Lutibacter sp. TaxID=437739 RepID=UPI00260AA5ED|nr:putative metal-binding motif-containing protein [uncultured Lutibacter sp.]